MKAFLRWLFRPAKNEARLQWLADSNRRLLDELMRAQAALRAIRSAASFQASDEEWIRDQALETCLTYSQVAALLEHFRHDREHTARVVKACHNLGHIPDLPQ